MSGRRMQSIADRRGMARLSNQTRYTGARMNRTLELRQHHPFQSWLIVEVRLAQLPDNITTWDLYVSFQKEGAIMYIEIFEDRLGLRDGKGKIKFAQPPALRPFWEQSPIMILTKTGSVEIFAKLQTSDRKFQIQSPIHRTRWYPEQMTLAPSAIRFGFMVDESAMNVMYTALPLPIPSRLPTQPDMQFKLNLLKTRFELRFAIGYPHKQDENPHSESLHTELIYSQFKFEVCLNQLARVYLFKTIKGQSVIQFSLENPPAYYKKSIETTQSHDFDGKALKWNEWDTWLRKTDIRRNMDELSEIPLSLDKSSPIIDIGMWTTYQIVFGGRDDDATFGEMQKALQDWNVMVEGDYKGTSREGTPSVLWSLLQTSQSGVSYMDELFLPFDVRYQLEVCISNGLLHEHNLDNAFLHKLSVMARKDQLQAIHILEWVVDQGKRIYNPISIFGDSSARVFKPTIAWNGKLSPGTMLMRKATVTPSLLIYGTPTVETSNRVLRKFSQYADRFLRIEFRDETGEGRIKPCVDSSKNEELYSRVMRTMNRGITIGDRHYEFLAFGNSQFKQNGAYMFSPTSEVACEAIRAWMGDFSSITVPAKYAARLGQCFSTTTAISSFKPRLRLVSDVERNGFCFTDGVGMMSEMAAALVAQSMKKLMPSIEAQPPSAFQFRLGGCKGMLVVWPAKAKGFDVWVRKSQQKFVAAYQGLEIIRWSKFSQATLNRQIIGILSCLGIPDEVFLKKLQQALAEYQEAMVDPTAALNLLHRRIDEGQTAITMADMVKNGFMASKDPFMMSLMYLWQSWAIKLLREKARITIDEGAFVLGVIDETATLQGYTNTSREALDQNRNLKDLPEIFLQVTQKTSNTLKIIEGPCIVGRNPSLHPGDIRVVRAVDCPALRHLRDVVVFSQNGDRDVPGMCSGGDLDGDDFFVLWDKELMISDWNQEPMDYTAEKPIDPGLPVRIKDVTRHFVTHMKNDTLATIATTHLARTDYLERGPQDSRCIELAKLHSRAVDYAKTGLPAIMPARLKTPKWPHFMENKYRAKESTYTSRRILGQLYDKVDLKIFTPQYKNSFDPRITKAFTKHSPTLEKVRKIKTEYDNALLRLMAQHEVATEFEIWSTFVLSRPRVGSDYKQQEDMTVISTALKVRFRDVVVDAAGGNTYDMLAPFVTAMYQVTEEEMTIALLQCRTTKSLGGRDVFVRKMEPKSMPLMSFPWLFPEVLGRIATGTTPHPDMVVDVVITDGVIPRKSNVVVEDRSSEDVLVTDQGVIHRGEQLDLFNMDNEYSESDGSRWDAMPGSTILTSDNEADDEAEVQNPQRRRRSLARTWTKTPRQTSGPVVGLIYGSNVSHSSLDSLDGLIFDRPYKSTTPSNSSVVEAEDEIILFCADDVQDDRDVRLGPPQIDPATGGELADGTIPVATTEKALVCTDDSDNQKHNIIGITIAASQEILTKQNESLPDMNVACGPIQDVKVVSHLDHNQRLSSTGPRRIASKTAAQDSTKTSVGAGESSTNGTGVSDMEPSKQGDEETEEVLVIKKSSVTRLTALAGRMVDGDDAQPAFGPKSALQTHENLVEALITVAGSEGKEKAMKEKDEEYEKRKSEQFALELSPSSGFLFDCCGWDHLSPVAKMQDKGVSRSPYRQDNLAGKDDGDKKKKHEHRENAEERELERELKPKEDDNDGETVEIEETIKFEPSPLARLLALVR